MRGAWEVESVESKAAKGVSSLCCVRGSCGERGGLIIYSHQRRLIPF